MKKFRVYVCPICHDVIPYYGEELGLTCCNEEMKELEANTSDGVLEKHVPVVKKEGSRIAVDVGSITHPMSEEHQIVFIALEEESGYQIHYLKPTDVPEAIFESKTGQTVYEYCNLHGLWKKYID